MTIPDRVAPFLRTISSTILLGGVLRGGTMGQIEIALLNLDEDPFSKQSNSRYKADQNKAQRIKQRAKRWVDD